MAIFKCLQSGNTVTFTLPHDIESMVGHQGYVRIDETPANDEADSRLIVMTPPTKTIGRPRKA